VVGVLVGWVVDGLVVCGLVCGSVVVAVDIGVFVFRGIWILGIEKTVVFTRFFGPRVVTGRIFDIPAVGR
jgi:hypothetical protein